MSFGAERVGLTRSQERKSLDQGILKIRRSDRPSCPLETACRNTLLSCLIM